MTIFIAKYFSFKVETKLYDSFISVALEMALPIMFDITH